MTRFGSLPPLLLAFLLIAGGAGWIVATTHTSIVTLVLSLAYAALIFIPLGGLIVSLVLPGVTHPGIRWPLVVGVGYAVAPPLILGLSIAHLIRWLVPLCATFAIGWWWLARRSRRPLEPEETWTPQARLGLLAIVVLSVVVITPFMTPVRAVGDGSVIDYAYIDNYEHLGFIRSLMRSMPLSEWPSLAGATPPFYPVYHHVNQAIVARLAGASASDFALVFGPAIVVVITTVLAYAVGLMLTRSTWGAAIAASLPYLVLVPNLYDRNQLLFSRKVPFLPNFYQLHFFSVRYAAHATSGDLVIALIVLLAAIALLHRDRRTQVSALLLMTAPLAALTLFRSQFALAIIPASVGLQLAMSGKKIRVAALIVTAVSVLALSSLPPGPIPRSTIRRVLPNTSNAGPPLYNGTFADYYGTFAQELPTEDYLPTIVRTIIRQLPLMVQPLSAVVALFTMRIVGFNHLLLIGWALSMSTLRTRLKTYNWYLVAIIVLTLLTTLVVDNSIGMNVILTSRMPVLLLIAPALWDLARRASARGEWLRVNPTLVASAALLAFAGVSYRGAEALLHERPDRAYPVTAEQVASYAWVRSQTHPAAVIAAHAEHLVNANRESIRGTNMLSGWTDRSIYVERVVFLRSQGERRREEMKRLFSTLSKDEACGVVTNANFDYLLEYRSEPLASGPLPCLETARAGDPQIYRVRRPAAPRSAGPS